MCGDEVDHDYLKNLRHYGKEHKRKAKRQDESRMMKDKEWRQEVFQMKRYEAARWKELGMLRDEVKKSVRKGLWVWNQ